MALHLVLANCLFFFVIGIMLTSYIHKDEVKVLNKELLRSFQEAEELREQIYNLTHPSPIRRK